MVYMPVTLPKSIKLIDFGAVRVRHDPLFREIPEALQKHGAICVNGAACLDVCETGPACILHMALARRTAKRTSGIYLFDRFPSPAGYLRISGSGGSASQGAWVALRPDSESACRSGALTLRAVKAHFSVAFIPYAILLAPRVEFHRLRSLGARADIKAKTDIAHICAKHASNGLKKRAQNSRLRSALLQPAMKGIGCGPRPVS